MNKFTQKIVVLDDDPTGSQTVHSCLLLTRWDVDNLILALTDDSPLFFILTNTRAMAPLDAARVTQEVCINLKSALEKLEQSGTDILPILVSRSDSTLRGHYPVETDIIGDELGGFDAHFLVPAFFEGGRVTRNATHYLMVNGTATPVHQTEFAKDSVFGYRHSFLPDYVEEKTQGRIKAKQVVQFNLADVRGDCLSKLMALRGNQCCCVDAETQQDLDKFSRQIEEASRLGKRFYFRSAASLLTSLAQLPQQPVSPQAMREYVRQGNAGAIIVGSHVKKTSEQLDQLLRQQNIVPYELDVDRVVNEKDNILHEAIQVANEAQSNGKTLLVYTSRKEKQFVSQQLRLQFGVTLSSLLMDIVRNLPKNIGFLISKGGITSNDVLSDGLSLSQSRVLGQILAGCSVVRCPTNHPRFPDLPVVIFPGNVGDASALATVYQRLTQ